MDPFKRLNVEVIACRKCPRLVAHRERVPQEKVRRYRDEEYWGKPIPGFGDPKAWGEAGHTAPALRPTFAHGAVAELPGGVLLLTSYHPSQQNTQTGRLTPAMFQRIFARARRVLADPHPKG